MTTYFQHPDYCVICGLWLELGIGNIPNICKWHNVTKEDFEICRCCEKVVDMFNCALCTWCGNPICTHCKDNQVHDETYDCYEDPVDV